MPKIEAAAALAGILISLSLASSVTAAPAAHDQMLRQLIHDTAQGHVPYQTLSPGLAEAVRPQAATAQAELSALGALKSVELRATQEGGMEIYRTVFEMGVLDWAFHVDAEGLIDNAIYKPVKTDPR